MEIFRSLVVFAIIYSFSSPLLAGICNTKQVSGPNHEFEFLAGYSPRSTKNWGTSEDRRIVLVGFAYSYRCWKLGSTAVKYVATALPVAIVFQPQYTVAEQINGTVVSRQISAHEVYGWSVMPIGFRSDFLERARVAPFAEAHGGVIASAEPIPVDVRGGTGLNFMVQLGGGVRWRINDGHALRIGYRLAHISNAYTSAINPGLDNNVISLGWSLLR